MAGMLLQFLLTVVIAGILYLNGEKAARGVMSLRGGWQAIGVRTRRCWRLARFAVSPLA
jgi:hypothetical protein